MTTRKGTVLDTVNSRTQLAGKNRMELLLFRLSDEDGLYGINVFKVQEVISMPKIHAAPNAPDNIMGIADIRGKSIPIIDLSSAISLPPLKDESNAKVILTEYSSTIQGFVVGGVDEIVNLTWGEVESPPDAMGKNGCITAITRNKGRFIEVLDVESVLSTIMGIQADVSDYIVESLNGVGKMFSEKYHILVADDSRVALKQITTTLDQMGIAHVTAPNGKAALEYLHTLEPSDGVFPVPIIISDVEMPELDGFSLTRIIREDPKLANMKVLLQSSMSGESNAKMGLDVGADLFIPKFQPDELAKIVRDYAAEVLGES